MEKYEMNYEQVSNYLVQLLDMIQNPVTYQTVFTIWSSQPKHKKN